MTSLQLNRRRFRQWARAMDAVHPATASYRFYSVAPKTGRLALHNAINKTKTPGMAVYSLTKEERVLYLLLLAAGMRA